MRLPGIYLFLVQRSKMESNLVFVVVLVLESKGLYYQIISSLLIYSEVESR